MDEDFWKLKIQAFLHDPPEKAIILMQLGESHEERAKELLRELIQDDDIEEVKKADTNASSADRINLPYFEKKFLDSPVIKHPLSGDQLDKINELSKTNTKAVVENAKSAVDKAIQEIKGENGDDPLKIYLAVWRKLPDLIKNYSSPELKLFWDVLPADTRTPDHSIWNHRNATAAFAGGIVTLPSPELNKGQETIYNLSFLLFSLGPVQEFIATARKTQDLWMGSYILSYLSWQAMKFVVDSFGPDVIVFPDLYKQPLVDKWLVSKITLEQPDINWLSTPTLPNRFLAILPQMKEGKYQPSEIAKRVKESVIAAWKEIAESVKKGLETKLGCKNPVWDKIWERQIEDFIEIYWVAYDWKENYKDVLEEYKSLIDTEMDKSWEMGKLLSLYEDKSKSKYPPTLGTMYQLLYEITERSLGSRKAIRDFKQSEETNYKCTLCGVREPLIDKEDAKPKESRDFWRQLANKGVREIRSDGGERLCAVCTTKRFAMKFYFRREVFENKDLGFPSVGTVATAAYQYAIVKNAEQLKDSIQEFNDKVGGFLQSIGADSRSDTLPKIKEAVNKADKELQRFIEIDGEWLYEETFNEKRLDKEYGFNKSKYEKEFEEAKHALDKLRKEVGKIGATPPSKYYAIIYMDGDNMGKWLSGEFAPNIPEIVHPEIKLGKDWNLKRPLSSALHSSVSSALRNFSLVLVRHIVEEKYFGKLVYAGGDDVLAFVTLSDLLKVMRDLRAFYSGFVDENGNADFKKGNGFIEHDGELLLTMGKKATASMGVVTPHYLQPLNQVMNKVREMEKEAKKDEKNAFAISLMKRSGGTEITRAKWFYDNGDFDTIAFIKQLSDYFTNGVLSTRFAYDFREKLRWMDGLNDKAISSEVLRLLNRHSDRKKSEKEMSEEEFKSLLLDIKKGLMKLRTELGKLEEISKILSLAVFLTKQGSEGEE